MLNKTVFKFILLVICLSPTWGYGQATEKVKDNSPYSRIGLGDLFNQNYAAIIGMGGLSAAFNDPIQPNLQNPASLGSLELTAFQAAFYGKYATLSDSDESLDVWSGDLAYLSLAFATRNRINDILDKKKTPYSWGMNFTLLPYSKVNYGVDISTPVQDTVEAINRFTGNGGTYKLMWGNGVKYKNWSFGVNLGYIFGKISDNRTVLLTDEFNQYYIQTQKEIGIGGFYWNAGLQYDWLIKKTNADGSKTPTNRMLTVGLFGNSKTKFETNSSILEYRQSSVLFPLDTTQNVRDIFQTGKLPAEFSIGAIYQKLNKYKIGINYVTTGWSGYENPAKPDQLDNANTISIGGEIIPDHLSYNNYFKKIRYRLGAFYTKDPRPNLNNFGLTFGFGLPIILPRETISFVNFGFEIGKFGDKNALNENYVRATLGFSLNDNSWFFKRKFN